MPSRTAGLPRLRSRESSEPPRENPFPGARPFEESEAKQFHGRDTERAELVALIRTQRLCLLYAPSGAGKSSLINAGLLSNVRRVGVARERAAGNASGSVSTATVGAGQADPGTGRGADRSARFGATSGMHSARRGVGAASDKVFDVIGVAKVHPSAVRGPEGWPPASKVPNVYVTAALNSLEPNARSEHVELTAFIEDRPYIRDEFGDKVPRLLVFDQFEEILEPYGRRDWLACRDDFFCQLDQALRADLMLHVLISIREDHLATMERLMSEMTSTSQARYRLDRLSLERAKDAMEEPAELSGLPFEPGLADKVLKELAQRRIDQAVEPVPDEFVEPGQLQVVCNRLWARADSDTRANRSSRGQITAQHLEDMKGVGGALSKYYDEAVSAVASGRTERRLREFVQKRLITDHDTRQLVPVGSDDRTERIPNSILGKLEREFGLVRRERRGGTSYWELSHDGFIEPIREANLKVWLRRRQRAAIGGIAMVAVVLVGAFIYPGFDSGPEVATVEPFPVDLTEYGSARVPLEERQGGTQMVVELVKPEDSTAVFELQRESRSGSEVVPPTPPARTTTEQAATSGQAIKQYELEDTANYAVTVSLVNGETPTIPFRLNVRTDAQLIELPDVLGKTTSEASDDLVGASLVVGGISKTCDTDVSGAADEVVRVIDLDRQNAILRITEQLLRDESGGADAERAETEAQRAETEARRAETEAIDDVLVGIDHPAETVLVATGTSVSLEALDPELCTEGALSGGARRGGAGD